VPESVPIVVQRAEWEAGRERAAIERNFFQPRDYEVEPRRLRLVEGDHCRAPVGAVRRRAGFRIQPGHGPELLRPGPLRV
jgi:hypothetical protein